MEGFEQLLGVNFFNAFFTLANTLLLFFVFKKFLYKPLMTIIKNRQKEIDDMYTDANAARDNAASMEEAYKQKLAAATETGERLVKEAVVRGQNREEAIIRQANEQADAIREKAAADIAMEKKKAINDAKNEISDMALAIAEKIVGRELNSADQEKLVDEFISGLGEQA